MSVANKVSRVGQTFFSNAGYRAFVRPIEPSPLLMAVVLVHCS
jgi:hypothetical protein